PDVALILDDMVRTIVPRDLDAAERLSREALAIRRKLLDPDHADVAWSLYNLAYVLLERDRASEAGELLEEIFAKRGDNLPDEHPVVSSSLLMMGLVKMRSGEHFHASKYFEACLDLRKRTLEPNHWLIAAAESHLGECLVYLGDDRRG